MYIKNKDIHFHCCWLKFFLAPQLDPVERWGKTQLIYAIISYINHWHHTVKQIWWLALFSPSVTNLTLCTWTLLTLGPVGPSWPGSPCRTKRIIIMIITLLSRTHLKLNKFMYSGHFFFLCFWHKMSNRPPLCLHHLSHPIKRHENWNSFLT